MNAVDAAVVIAEIDTRLIPLRRRYFDALMQRCAYSCIPPNPQGSQFNAHPEDYILCFLTLYQRGNGTLAWYWRNALRLIHAQGDELDIVFLMNWAAEFQVTHLLERALVEASQA